MNAFDIIVLTLLGGGAVLGFKNGFVQAAVSLIAWVAGIFALRLFHAPVTALLKEPVGNDSGAAALALIGLYLGTYLIGKLLANSLGRRTRKSILGPIDRVLGFGFGAVKGLIAATLAYLLLTMGHDIIWPGEGQPEWLRDARTFPLLNASGNALIDLYEYQQQYSGE
jgi:membrane protein required for colicin V production